MDHTTFTSDAFDHDAAGARRAAAAGPVFIVDHGHPAHVLLTIEDYRRLLERRRSIADLLHHPGAAEVELDLPVRDRSGLNPADFC